MRMVIVIVMILTMIMPAIARNYRSSQRNDGNVKLECGYDKQTCSGKFQINNKLRRHI